VDSYHVLRCWATSTSQYRCSIVYNGDDAVEISHNLIINNIHVCLMIFGRKLLNLKKKNLKIWVKQAIKVHIKILLTLISRISFSSPNNFISTSSHVNLTSSSQTVNAPCQLHRRHWYIPITSTNAQDTQF
jgi:hypothetical protein